MLIRTCRSLRAIVTLCASMEYMDFLGNCPLLRSGLVWMEDLVDGMYVWDATALAHAGGIEIAMCPLLVSQSTFVEEVVAPGKGVRVSIMCRASVPTFLDIHPYIHY